MKFATLLKGFLFPCLFAGSLYAFYLMRASGVEPIVALLALSVGNLALVALVEMAVPYRRDWNWWRDRQSINDLVHGALLSAVGPRLGEIILASSIAAGAAWIAGLSGGGVWPNHWPLWIQMLMAIVLADFTDWAKHWGYHHIGAMWPIHALHHDVDRLHVIKAARLHFLESTLRFAIISAPLLVLGAGPEVILWYGAISNVLGNLNHSNIDMPMPGFAHYIFQSPQNHRLHHEIDPDLGRSNLSGMSMIPDLLFGTFRHPDRHPLKTVGVEGSPIPSNLLVQIITPFVWPALERRRREQAARS